MSNNSIWPIDTPLYSSTIPSQSGPESNSNKGVLRIPQSSSITGASSSYRLVSLEESYPSVVIQSVYSAVPVDWATHDTMY